MPYDATDYKVVKEISFKNLMEAGICKEGLEWHAEYNADFQCFKQGNEILEIMADCHRKDVVHEAFTFWLDHGFIERNVRTPQVGEVWGDSKGSPGWCRLITKEYVIEYITWDYHKDHEARSNTWGKEDYIRFGWKYLYTWNNIIVPNI